MRYDLPTRQHYIDLFTKVVVKPSRVKQVDAIVDRIVKNKERYKAAEILTKVPWYVIGCIHSLEADFNFHTIIANGDPLGVPTHDVPRGLIAHTWEEGVLISFKQNGISDNRDWSLPCLLFYVERYNGPGYHNKGLNSPYLWSFTNNYVRGKYVEDNDYDPDAVSGQCGAAAILKRMIDRGILALVKGDPMSGPADVISEVAGVVEAPVVLTADAVKAVVAPDTVPANTSTLSVNNELANDTLVWLGAFLTFLTAHHYLTIEQFSMVHTILGMVSGFVVSAIGSMKTRNNVGKALK